MSDLAAKANACAMLFKEFGEPELAAAEPLRGFGYQRFATLPLHYFRPVFESLQHYREGLRARYRYRVNHLLRKLEAGGLQVSVLPDPADILEVYTPELHGVYYQVLRQSNTRFETLPVEFFRELASRLPGHVDLVLIRNGSRISTFGWCVKAGPICDLLFIGLDYTQNEAFDLYSNLIYALLDRGLHTRPTTITVGVTGRF